MGRGKTQIKKIENLTNRQVTFSKRRNGLFKKAKELSVMCDAKVSIIIISHNLKLYEFLSDNITTKEVFDRYQKATGKDLWISQYRKMQEELRQLKAMNLRLKREMRQRMGEDLSDLSYDEQTGLEHEMEAAFKLVHERHIKKLEATKKRLESKVKNEEDNYQNILFQLGERCYDFYGFVKNEEAVKNEEDVPVATLGNGTSYLF